MGDLEEALNCHFHLVDSWNVWFQHFLMIASSLLIFSLYGIFLWLLCSLSPDVPSSLLLLGIQIGIGIPVTRAYYDFGISTRNQLHFFDSGLYEVNQEIIDLKINIGDIPLLFERMELQVRKFDKSKFDDLTDLSWFLVIVWAVVSSGAFFVKLIGQLLSVFGVVILFIACIMCYASGFWTNRGFSFEEDLNHLEYYIHTFVKSLDTSVPDINGTLIIQIKPQKRSSILVDIASEFIFGDMITLEYHFGLSSNLQERFIMDAPDEIIETTFEQLGKDQSILHSGWNLERVLTQSGLIIRIVNPISKLSIADRKSFVISPYVVELNSRAVKDILSVIVHTIKGLHMKK